VLIVLLVYGMSVVVCLVVLFDGDVVGVVVVGGVVVIDDVGVMLSCWCWC